MISETNDEKFLSFSHRAKDGVCRIISEKNNEKFLSFSHGAKDGV